MNTQKFSIDVERVRLRHTFTCLLIGTCGLYLPASAPFASQEYRCDSVECPLMVEELSHVASTLDIATDMCDDRINQLANGLYVHTYCTTLSVTLPTANCFFDFALAKEALPS